MRTRVVNIHKITQEKRFDGSFYNAEINIYNDVIGMHSSHNLDYYCHRIYTSGRNKRVYTTKEFGYPFLSNSDVSSSYPFNSCNYSSKKYGYDENAVLKGGLILTGRVGAIGQTAFVPCYWERYKAMGSDNIIRIQVKNKYKNGFIYAYLASKIGNLSFLKHSTGGVQPFITDKMVAALPIPDFSESFQKEVDDLIQESAKLREEATDALEEAQRLLKREANLRDLTPEYYDYYGPRNDKRVVSCFTINRKDITTTTINAFNLSARIRKTKQMMPCEVMPLREILVGGETFSSSAVSSTEVKPQFGVMFINQKDIFDNIVKGKWISKKNIQEDKLVEYGEVIVACDGTLGESELFCRALFANEDLTGSLISTHFIRMKTNNVVPSGYLYLWLNSDYGFRFIRNTQAGTKLCHPIPKLFLDIPVPIINSDKMAQLDQIVRNAHTKRYQANCKERKAISLVESEIEKWYKN